jgi:hypothetical protein
VRPRPHHQTDTHSPHRPSLFCRATSGILAQHSHGKGIDTVIEMASKVVNLVKESGAEVRFSCEDSFRSDPTVRCSSLDRVDAVRGLPCWAGSHACYGCEVRPAFDPMAHASRVALLKRLPQ